MSFTLDKIIRNVEVPYDEERPAEIKDQMEQFRRDPCDQRCVDDCVEQHLAMDCEWECGCA